jgi:hypothetical protein
MVTSNESRPLPVIVIGAGPVGLAAAAELFERGIEPIVLEAAREVAASVRDFGHVRLFSPWRFNIDKAAQRLLEANGWVAPPLDDLPTGEEIYRLYLRPLAQLPAIAAQLRVGRRVVAVTRQGLDKTRTARRGEAPFIVHTRDTEGHREQFVARAVIDASGTWSTPNPLGSAGVAAEGEALLKDRIRYGIPDVQAVERKTYADRTTLVVGAGHSAANSILALLELKKIYPKTKILWATRGHNLTRVFGGGDADALPARGRLGLELRAAVETGALTMIARFQIEGVRAVGDRLEVSGTRNGERVVEPGIDRIIAATGQRPDLAITRELRLSLDPALESVAELGPLIDPNVHSCGSVRPHGARELAHPEPSFYIIGSKSYGRAPTFLLATGYEQARSVAAMLAGDEEAALRVELDLPETGVCSTNFQEKTEQESACCATPKKSCC